MQPKARRLTRRLAPWRALVFVICFSLWAAPTVVFAATPAQSRKARALSKQGAKAFKAGDFQEAVKQFKAANRLVPHPNLDVNIGRAYEAMGQPDQAMVHCKIALNAAGVPQRTQKAAQTCIDRVTAQLARPTLEIETTPSGATVRIDGALMGKTPWRGSTEPGRRQLDLELKGYKPLGEALNAARGKHYPLTLTLERAALGGLLTVISVPPGAQVTANGEPIGKTPIERAPLAARTYVLQMRKPGYQTYTATVLVSEGETMSRTANLVARSVAGRPTWPAWTLLGTGVATVGAGAFFGVQALGDRSDADKLARTSNDPGDEGRYNSLLSSMEDNRSTSDVLMVTGSAVLVGALVYYLWPDG